MRCNVIPILVLIALLRSSVLAAAVDLCVQVKSDVEAPQGLEKLVRSEIGRHPTHRGVKSDCQSQLTVDLFEVDGKKFLTARIDQEVPVRYRITEDNPLESVLVRAITLVLGSDPVYLAEDITHYSAVQRATHAVLKKGHNVWRVELFETLGRDGDGVLFAPGAAVSATRGSEHWRVLARIYFAGWPGSLGEEDTALRISTGADLGLTFEFSSLSNSTFYLSAGAGLQYLRYEGRLDGDPAADIESIDEIGAILFARLGVRFLRLYDFDCDLFATGDLPLFNTNDPDIPLFGDEGLYTPSIQVGLGVGF